MAKTKALISFAITAKLICVFVFAYVKSWFSHDATQMSTVIGKPGVIGKSVFATSVMTGLKLPCYPTEAAILLQVQYFCSYIHVILAKPIPKALIDMQDVLHLWHSQRQKTFFLMIQILQFS